MFGEKAGSKSNKKFHSNKKNLQRTIKIGNKIILANLISKRSHLLVKITCLSNKEIKNKKQEASLTKIYALEQICTNEKITQLFGTTTWKVL